jgi:hypothetical protein
MPSNLITVLRARRVAVAAISVAAVALGSAGSSAHAAGAENGGPEMTFLTQNDQNDQAMTRMMDGMSIKPSGGVDRDFTAMMAPHHQDGASALGVFVSPEANLCGRRS